MKEGKQKSSRKLLMLAVCVAFALEFVGCKEGTGGTSTTEPASGTAGATNSATTNASMSADTNTSAAATTSQ